LFSNLPIDVYYITFNSSGYASNSYIVTIANRTAQSLNIYLFSNASTSSIGFYTKSLSDAIISGASLSFYTLINTTYVGVAQASTDGTGFVTFNLVAGETYRLIITADNYDIYQVDFVPYSVNSPYTFKLTPSSSFMFSSIDDYVRFYYSPVSTGLNGSSQWFNFTTYSINGTILSTNISCNGVSSQSTGSPSGSGVSVLLNVSSLSVINCQFGFTASETGAYVFNITYRAFTPFNTSFIGSSDRIRNSTSSLYLTLLAYFIICLACLGMRRVYPDPRITGIIICGGLIFFVALGWVDEVAGGVSATIGLFLLFMGSR
jgi:hypothetical protein